MTIRFTLLLLFGTLSFGFACQVPASDEDVLQQYLQRLGLDDLQMQQLEKMIQLPRSKEQIQQDVKKLADLYVSQLLAAADDSQRRDSLVNRVNGLLEKFPNAKTPALDVMLLQADYAAAELAAEKWLADPSQAASLATANEILSRIAPELGKYQSQLDGEIEALNKRLDAVTSEKQMAKVESELRQAQQVAGRARFYSAWSLYYLAALNSSQPQAGSNFAKARDIFRTFLGIEDDYGNLTADDLGLESPAIARAMIGLVQAEIGSGNLPASRECLDLLANSQAPLDLRQQQAFWYLQGLINANLLSEAAGFATSLLSDDAGSNQASQLSVSVCAAVAGLARSKTNDDCASARDWPVFLV